MIPREGSEALLQGSGNQGKEEKPARAPALSRGAERQRAAAAGHFPRKAAFPGAFPGEERRQAG